MKKVILLVALVAGVSTLYQCSSSKKTAATPKPEASELSFAQKRWPDITQASLDEGQTIYNTRCNKCHRLKKIENFSEAEWEKEIIKMSPKAKLTDAERESMRRYILAAHDALVPSK